MYTRQQRHKHETENTMGCSCTIRVSITRDVAESSFAMGHLWDIQFF
jgi:hypothetical protein